MSFRLFVYHSALCGAAAGLFAWAVGRLTADGTVAVALHGLALGLGLGLALALVETAAHCALRQHGLTLQRLLTVGGLGLAGGFLGGSCAAALGRSAPFLGLLLGWGLAGLVIGAAPGAFDWLLCLAADQDCRGSRRKTLFGLVGGFLGGLLGALLLRLCRSLWGDLFAERGADQLWSPTAWGDTFLGAAIAAGVHLVQVLTRLSWLRFEEGRWTGCELLLTRPLLTLGSGPDCDIGLAGDPRAEPLHARLERHGKRYLLLDVSRFSGTFVNGQRLTGPHILCNGDLIGVGVSVLRFLDLRE